MAKTEAQRSKELRERKSQGGRLSKREVWILPEHTERLRKYEKKLQK